MGVLRVFSSARRRWKALLWLLLMLVVLLNAVVFVGMPGSARRWGRATEDLDLAGRRTVEGASHLQILRKGLDKSTANNSSSLHYVEWDGKGGVNFDPQLARKQLQQRPWKDVLGGKKSGEKHEFVRTLFDESNNENAKRGNPSDKEDGEDEGDDDEGVAEQGAHEENHSVQGRMREATRSKQRVQETAQSNNGGAGVLGARDTVTVGRNYTLAEVDALVKTFLSRHSGTLLTSDNGTGYDKFLRRLQEGTQWGRRLDEYATFKGKRSWEHFHHGIRQHALYDPNDPSIKRLMDDLKTREIVDAEQKEGGTQIKLMITCEDEGQALFKPMRFPRGQETLPDHFYFADYERHVAEIAAFHLDMALGFYRVPPTVGRLVNISRDIHRVANSKLAKTFFISPVGNWCFHGSCSYYCDSSHPICGHPIMLEGSMAAFLPPLQMAKRKTWRNPWKRSYSKHRKAYWEVYDDLCTKVKRKPPYNEGRRLMDVLDMSIFDFLTGNLDRHHYETFREFGNDTFLLHLDNGRAFGKSQYDCISCLAPVRQCCMIRQSTLAKLVKLYQGPESLSQVMRTSLAADSLNPVLIQPHLDALDRRLSKILHVIHGCMKEGGGRRWDDVVIDDGVT